MWMGSARCHRQRPVSGCSYIPWISLSLQTLAVLGWVVHVFRDRVLGFARDNATSA